jgi:hypothetical protein
MNEFRIKCLDIVCFFSVFIRAHNSRISSILPLRSLIFCKIVQAQCFEDIFGTKLMDRSEIVGSFFSKSNFFEERSNCI